MLQEKKETWVSPTGIEYEFYERDGYVISYYCYPYSATWVIGRSFKDFDEIQQWKQKITDDYNGNSQNPIGMGKDVDPYSGSGNYVGD